MPVDWSKYPKDWKQISLRIRKERAGNKCEWCNAPNGETVWRCQIGQWYPDGDYAHMAPNGERRIEFATPYSYEMHKRVKIVLTVAHLDHDTTHNTDDNLAALCQQCHLRYDAKLHAKNSAETRRRKKIESGQMELSNEPHEHLSATPDA